MSDQKILDANNNVIKKTQLINFFDCILSHSKKGILKTEFLYDLIIKFSNYFCQTGSNFTRLSEKVTNDDKLTEDFFGPLKNNVDCLITSISRSGETYNKIHFRVENEIIVPFYTRLKEFRSVVKSTEKEQINLIFQLKRAKGEVTEQYGRAIKNIESEYDRYYKAKNGKGNNNRERIRTVFSKSFNRVRMSMSQASTPEEMRKYVAVCNDYNNLCDKYYDEQLPGMISTLLFVEKERVKIITEAFQRLPMIISQYLSMMSSEFKESMSKNNHWIEEDKFSISSDLLPEDDEQAYFGKVKEKYIDKDKEVVRLKIKNNDIFDSSLNELIQFPHNDGRKVPLEIESVCQFIAKNGLSVEGIFRISGNNKDIAEFRQNIAEKKFYIPPQTDVHVCSCFLKQFLHQMSEPIIPFVIKADCFIIANELTEKKITGSEAIKRIEKIMQSKAEKLYLVNKCTLKYLMCFLNVVSMNSTRNKMNAENLAIIFTPTMFLQKKCGDPMEQMGKTFIDVKKWTNFMKLMIENAFEIDWGVDYDVHI